MSESMKKNVLITGASGVLGRQVTRRFIEVGWNVTGDEILSKNQLYRTSLV